MREDPNFFQKIISEAMPDSVVTNFVVIAEVVNEQGTNLQVILSDGITPWLASGMIEYASDMLYTGSTEFGIFQEGDDE